MRAFVQMQNYTSTIPAELAEIRAKLTLLERNDEDNAEAVNDLSEDMRKEQYLSGYCRAIAQAPTGNKTPNPYWVQARVKPRSIVAMKPRKIYAPDELIPYEPTHPGEVLKEELECRGISQRKIAAIVGMSSSTLNGILNSKRPVTARIALLFEAALGIEAEMWIKMQSRYDMQVARKDSNLMARLEQIRKAAVAL